LAGSATGSSASIVFTHRLVFGFLPHTAHAAPVKVKFQLDQLRGVGLQPPKLKKFGILPI